MKEYVISDSKSIERLFITFKTNKNEITLRHDLKEFSAEIYQVSQVSITLFFKGNIPEDAVTIELSTTQGSTVYFATSRVLDISSGEITLSLPEELEKGVKRKYIRVNTKDDVFLKFNVISNSDEKLDTKNYKKKIPPQYIEIYKELERPVPDFKRIFLLLSQELKKKAPLFEIKLHKDDEIFPKRIEILKNYKKTLYISNVRDSKSYLKDTLNKNVITFLQHIHNLKTSGKDEGTIKAEIIQIMREDISTKAISYICSPIILFNTVIGHIFLGILQGSHKMFYDQDIEFVQSSADIIAEALAKGKLNQLNTGDDFNVATLDLSGGGVLMQLNDPNILKHLTQSMKLKIVLKVREKEVKTVGKIIRINRENGDATIAVKFLEIRWNDRDEIEKYVSIKFDLEKMKKK